VFDSGGQFWPTIFRWFIFGLIVAQMTITGQFIFKEARHEAYGTLALIFMTNWYLRSTRARYNAPSSTLPLEVATMMDISVAHYRDARSSKQRKEQQKTNSGQRGSIPPNIQQAQSIDTMDGAFDELQEIDSFLHAYRQPAL